MRKINRQLTTYIEYIYIHNSNREEQTQKDSDTNFQR